MKVYKKVKCENCARFPSAEGRCWVEGCMGDDWRLKELSPPALDKMNLDALGVLGELKAEINDNTAWHNGTGLEILHHIRDLESAADLKPAKPEDVTVILSKVLDIIEEEGEMVPGRGAPNKIAVRPLLDSLDGLDKYPVPQEDKPFAEAQDKPNYEAMLKAIRLEIQGHIEAGISSPTWEEVLGKIKRIKEAFKHEPTKPEPDHKAMIEDLETDSNQTYAWQLSVRSNTLKDILKKVRAEHTPQAKPQTEQKPEVKDEKVD